MDDRKRPAYDQDEIAPPLKRQAIGAANGGSRGHQDADLPGKDDLERFQKDAIYRQMQEYKREKTTLESQLNDLKKRAAHHDDHLRTIDTWFSQLLDELKVLAGDLQEGNTYSAFPSTLLAADGSAFDKHLKSRAAEIESAVKSIFAKGKSGEPGTSDLKERIAKLLATEKEHVNQLEKTRLEKDEMEERLETASMRYMMAEKKLDRAKSITVAKLEKQALAGGGDAGSGGGADGVKSEGVKGTVDSQALTAVETSLKEALGETAKQAEQLDELSKENQKLVAQITELRLKASQHTDEDYAHTELFKQAKKQLEDLVNRINGLEAVNTELRREAKKLQAERAAYRTEVDTELQASISEKELQLSKAEGDLARIRAARDELYAELQTRKQSQDQEKASTEQLKQLLAAKDERIAALESEAERLRSSQTDVTDAIAELPLEELRTKYATMERQYSMMNQELAAMSAAYKKLSSSVSQKVGNLADMEEKVAKYAAEKSKADQKYFGAMKAKDAREQEVRTLRAQNSKSSEIVAQLKELEASSRQLVIGLEKQVAESKEAFSILETKHYAVQGQVTEKAASAETLKKQVEELKAMVQTKDADNSTAASSLRKAEVQIEKLKVSLAEKDKHFETFRKTNVSGDDSDIHEQLRRMALCNVCHKQFKNMAIKTCGHVFCKDCVDERLTNRLRKCPNCGKAFGANDVMKVSL